MAAWFALEIEIHCDRAYREVEAASEQPVEGNIQKVEH
jgi:hypothetical protein